MIEGYYDRMRREALERTQQQKKLQTIQQTTAQTRQQTLQQTTTQPRQQTLQQTRQQTIQQQSQQTHQQTIQQQSSQTHQQTTAQTTTAKKSHRFQMRMTTQQHNKVKHLKSVWKLKTESAVIDRLIETADENQSTQTALAQNVQELTKIRSEINKIGVNINQIAKSANSNTLSQRDIQYLYNLCSQMNSIIYAKKEVK